jgi:hypothetical protein
LLLVLLGFVMMTYSFHLSTGYERTLPGAAPLPRHRVLSKG